MTAKVKTIDLYPMQRAQRDFRDALIYDNFCYKRSDDVEH
ncbi:hypothetical protein NIES4102_20200 [Chondrocystis sp. NIES-4102]|nr:hypothetical protein NIES4102_20200 [Chondrocystis sp. NIES-4102]